MLNHYIVQAFWKFRGYVKNKKLEQNLISAVLRAREILMFRIIMLTIVAGLTYVESSKKKNERYVVHQPEFE